MASNRISRSRCRGAIRTSSLIAFVFLTAGGIVPPFPLAAQNAQKPPKRPELAAAADTNDAMSYFVLGLTVLGKEPHKAADAFYWASRLAPDWAEPLYARRIALHVSEPRRLDLYLDGGRQTLRSKQIQQIDSLALRALMRDPLIYRGLDRLLIEAVVIYQFARARGNVMFPSDYAEVHHLIGSWLRRAGPEVRAWYAYTQSKFVEAAELYGTALKKKSGYKPDLYADRSRAFFQAGELDSAVVAMTLGLEELKKQDEKDLVRTYEPKAAFEHSIGLMLEKKGDLAGAREAYARALQEDLSYYPAHLRTATLAMAEGDTASALGTLELATQIAEYEGIVHYLYGAWLVRAKKHAEAEPHLRKAIELEPYYAEAYLALAVALDAQTRGAEAAIHYQIFLDKAPREHQRRGFVQGRLSQLPTATKSDRLP